MIFRSNRVLVTVTVLVLMLGTDLSRLSAHPFHLSLCEMEWNPETGQLECALRVDPGDLERVLRTQEKRAVDLDRTPRVDAMIQRYLARHFLLSRKKEQQPGERRPLRLKWVGKEVSLKYAWLYFEVDPGPVDGDVRLRVGLFHEILEDQKNTVNFRRGKQRYSAVFDRDAQARSIDAWLRGKSQKPTADRFNPQR